jgi:hypothetical protein
MATKTVIGSDNSNPNHQVEIIGDQTIEPVVASEFDKKAQKKMFDEEAFMNEIVEIEIATSTNENDPPHILLNVNGTSMPLIRGVPLPVKRKYVEVLARCKETKYRQPTRDMANPEAGNTLLGNTALTYPFQVLKDTARGMAWLQAVKAEAA